MLTSKSLVLVLACRVNILWVRKLNTVSRQHLKSDSFFKHVNNTNCLNWTVLKHKLKAFSSALEYQYLINQYQRNLMSVINSRRHKIVRICLSEQIIFLRQEVLLNNCVNYILKNLNLDLYHNLCFWLAYHHQLFLDNQEKCICLICMRSFCKNCLLNL